MADGRSTARQWSYGWIGVSAGTENRLDVKGTWNRVLRRSWAHTRTIVRC